MKLVIGNKNYSSWSLRPWLLLHANNIEFSEVNESLKRAGLSERLGNYSGSRKVPVLIDKDLAVWDSLSICEYVSEVYLEGNGWPLAQAQRALARSLCAEMHSGFSAVRTELPMNCRLSMEMTPSEKAMSEIGRIDAIWSEYAEEANCGSTYLFGKFGIADCFFAPIALRFKSYGISVSVKAARYQESILSHPSVCTWVAQSDKDTEIVPEIEI